MELEKSVKIQDDVSWLSVICAMCEILLLAVYIMWSPGEPKAHLSQKPEKEVIQLRLTDPASPHVPVNSYNDQAHGRRPFHHSQA